MRWVSWSLVPCLFRFLSPPRRFLALPPSSPSSSSCHPPSSCLCLAGCRPARPSRAVRRSDPASSARPSDPESTRREKTQNHFIICEPVSQHARTLLSHTHDVLHFNMSAVKCVYFSPKIQSQQSAKYRSSAANFVLCTPDSTDGCNMEPTGKAPLETL